MEIQVLGWEFTIDKSHDNIVVESLLEDFFENFNDIPKEEIQALIDKNRKG